VALVVCVVSLVEAGQVAPVFSWAAPRGTELVLTTLPDRRSVPETGRGDMM